MILKRYKKPIITAAGGLTAAAVLFVVGANIVAAFTLRDAYREYTNFGDSEINRLKDEMGITLGGSSSPEKLTVSHAAGDYCYQLWLRDTEPPQKFMEDCFDGKYETVDVSALSGSYDLDHDGEKPESAEEIFRCEYVNSGGVKRFDCYYAAFYRDGGGFKAKLFASKN